MGERRWLVIASDGRHVTIGRRTDPAPEALEEAGERLRSLGLAGWLAVSDGDYHGPGRLDLLLVRPLCEVPGATWEEARVAFLTARRDASRASRRAGASGRALMVERVQDVPEGRRRNMSAVRGKHTKPELLVRSMLHRMGYRYHLHGRDLPGRPDIVFPARRKAIEVRGCFWHRHPDPACRNAVMPATRREWWEAKLAANVARDARNLAALEGAGWTVLVLWECEVRRDQGELAQNLRAFLGSPGRSGAHQTGTGISFPEAGPHQP